MALSYGLPLDNLGGFILKSPSITCIKGLFLSLPSTVLAQSAFNWGRKGRVASRLRERLS